MTAHFTPEQTAALAAPLDRKHVKPPAPGRFGAYIESWHAIAEANRIFGFDGWSSETVSLTVVTATEATWERWAKGQRGVKETVKGWDVAYLAKVRITVGGVVREGTGAGTGRDASLGLAHESAAKEAESDARKRALMTFGNPFGLALYDKTQANVADVSEQDAIEQLTQPKEPAAQQPRVEPPPAKPSISQRASASISDPKEERRAAREARSLQDRLSDSAEAKAALLGHLAVMVPGKTTWDAEWNVYEQTAKHAKRRLSIADTKIVETAEDRRRAQHKQALEKQRAEAA